MTPEERRRKRLQELGQKIRDDGQSDTERILGWGAIRWGCRVERVKEYLGVLVMAGKIVQTKDYVRWVG